MCCLGETPIGFAAWDARGAPTARIGHSCIVPELRGRGYGVQQLRHTVDTLRAGGFTRVLAWTGDVPLFAPTRRMYERCGFKVLGTNRPAPGVPFVTIDHALEL